MHTKFERLLSKSLTTLEVMVYYLVVHTGPGQLTMQENQEILATTAKTVQSNAQCRQAIKG